MATRPARFPAIPNIPQGGLTDWQFSTLNAMKENIELLTGARGTNDRAASAVTKASITTAPPPAQSMQRVTAEGSGFQVGIPAMTTTTVTSVQPITSFGISVTVDFNAQTVSSAVVDVVTAQVPQFADFGTLLNDVANTRNAVNGLSAPSLSDYGQLILNVQQLANDVAALRNTVVALVNNLKG
jgi:hypothetical protein